MRRRTAFAAIAFAAFVAVLLAAFAGRVVSRVEASNNHFPRITDACQVSQSCPSVDGSYRWGERGWLCVKATAYEPEFRSTVKIRYGGLTYLCKR